MDSSRAAQRWCEWEERQRAWRPITEDILPLSSTNVRKTRPETHPAKYIHKSSRWKWESMNREMCKCGVSITPLKKGKKKHVYESSKQKQGIWERDAFKQTSTEDAAAGNHLEASNVANLNLWSDFGKKWKRMTRVMGFPGSQIKNFWHFWCSHFHTFTGENAFCSAAALLLTLNDVWSCQKKKRWSFQSICVLGVLLSIKHFLLDSRALWKRCPQIWLQARKQIV